MRGVGSRAGQLLPDATAEASGWTQRIHPRALSLGEREELLGVLNSGGSGIRRLGKSMPRY